MCAYHRIDVGKVPASGGDKIRVFGALDLVVALNKQTEIMDSGYRE